MRTRLTIPPDDRSILLRRLAACGGKEVAVLATCNRTEIFFTGLPPHIVIDVWASYAGLDAVEIQSHLYQLVGVCAACHLFRVTSGLESAVLGETEIVAQVKDAWHMAREAATAQSSLNLSFQRALATSKRVRTETPLAKTVTSTATLAVRTALVHLRAVPNPHIVVLGAGSIAIRLVKELRAVGQSPARVLSRTPDHAAHLVDEPHRAGGLDELFPEITRADVVFAALGGGKPILDATEIAKLRENRPLLVVDLGMPPNVEGTAPGLTHIRLDELTKAAEVNQSVRNAALEPAHQIVEQELLRWIETVHQREAAPTIQALVQRGDDIRQENLNWAKARLGHLTDKEMRVVEELTKRMMLGLLEAPLEGLKGELSAQPHRNVVERLFALERGPNA